MATNRDWRNSTPTALGNVVRGFAQTSITGTIMLFAIGAGVLLLFGVRDVAVYFGFYIFCLVLFPFGLFMMMNGYYTRYMLIHYPPTEVPAPKDRIVPLVVNRRAGGVGAADEALEY